ncbi:MAG: 30S ribosomal protein S24e [Thermoplasmata archaeon]
METEIVSRKENPLLDRVEIEFRTRHPNEPTPTRDLIREEIAKIAKAKKNLVIIDGMRSEFGKPETTGYAKVYKSKEKVFSVEREHILIRNGLLKPKKEPKKKEEVAEKEEAEKEEAEEEKEKEEEPKTSEAEKEEGSKQE